MVPEDGLEPSRPKATDFESVVSTNSTTPAKGCSTHVSMQRSRFYLLKAASLHTHLSKQDQ